MLETALIAYIAQHALLPEQGTVIVAVSGGADSLCLLHLLHQLCGWGKKYPGVQLHVAHLNHQMRGLASEQDANAVARIARAWNLPVIIGAVDVPALAREEQRSLEDAARTARYRFLREVAQGQPIAVAHHRDDQVETLLLHYLRGGGLASMVGLQPRQQDIIRPLLCITHADTLAYCAKHALIPLEDASNTDPRFLRNRIRHELLPLLESMNPSIRETLLRNAEVVHVDLAWLEAQVGIHWSEVVASTGDECIQLHLQPLLALPVSLRRHLLRRVSAHLCAGQSPLELRHYRLLEKLILRESTAVTLTLHLPQQLHFMRVGETLTFERVHLHAQPDPAYSENVEVCLPVPGRLAVPGTPWIALAETLPVSVCQEVQQALRRDSWSAVWRILPSTSDVVYVDAERLWPGGDEQMTTLSVRTRRAGDRIQPLGMTHTKKVQDVLVDKHIPRGKREQLPLFFSADQCIWLAGVQLAERVRLTRETRSIVRLSIISIE